MKIKITIIIFCLFVLFNINSESTRLIAKLLKLEVDDSDGRFLLYGRNSTENDWTPLFFEDSPSTNYFRFYMDKNPVSFGEEGEGRNANIEIVNNSIIYTWYNDKIKIELIYTLIASSEKSNINTLLIDLSVENISISEYKVDYFFCLDTYLGENEKKHFKINDETIRTEREISNLESLDFINSSSEEEKIGINIFFNKDKQITPDRVFVSNWRRVNSTIGNYSVFTNRNFDLKPYSINDSSLFIEYKNIDILPDLNRKYRFIISMDNKLDSIKSKETENNNIFADNNKTTDNNKIENNKTDENNNENKIDEKNYDLTTRNGRLNLVNLNLKELLELLDQINKKLENNEPLSQNDIDLTEQILNEIKKRKL